MIPRLLLLAAFVLPMATFSADRVDKVTNIPGLVAFWDFVKREPEGDRRFLAHVPAGAKNEYALDAGNYIKDYWGEGREATYADFPLLGRGPFGEAIRIRAEEDATFRPLLYVPRARLHDTPLDIKGPGKSVTVVVWAIRESGNHALAGIWHEGTDLKQDTTTAIRKVERGQGNTRSSPDSTRRARPVVMSRRTGRVPSSTVTPCTSATRSASRRKFPPIHRPKSSTHRGAASR